MFTNWKCACVVLFAVAAVVACGATAQGVPVNLIQNGSFETATLQTPFEGSQPTELGTVAYVQGYATVQSAGVTGWTSNDRVWYMGDKDVSPEMATASAPDGNWVARIGDTGGVVAGLSQQVTLTANTSYTFAMDAWGEGSPQNSIVNVRLSDGTNNLMIVDGYVMSHPLGTYETITRTFTPTFGGNLTLLIYNTGVYNDPVWATSFSIDNVRLTAEIPEPGTTALTILGVGGLLAYAWRKRKQS